MTISIWRYSHMLLAVSSAIFIFIASVTGAILAFEPITNGLHPYAVEGAAELSLAKTLDVLQSKYDEVIALEKEDNDFLVASVMTKSGKSETFYVNPFTGEKLGDLIAKKPIFEFATNLHRSLFLKSTGRFLVGFFSLLLGLIAITGLKLILKRQGGFKRFFSKVVKENFEQYYHVVIGRFALIPLLIITITGVILSMEKFDMLPSDKLVHLENGYDSALKNANIEDFEIFQSTTLGQFNALEFPFSGDEEDYFVLNLKNKELFVHQYNGSIVSKAEVPVVTLVSNWSLFLHTGQGNSIWAVVLFLSCIAILFFMYSGFAMTLKRQKHSKTVKNTYSKDIAEYIVLMGSETGHTQNVARQFYEALLSQGKKCYIDQLNNYSTYKSATHLIVFTSTYGEGEAPSNANKFDSVLTTIVQDQAIKYSVVGFGSQQYPDFCKFAIRVDALLQQHPKFTPLLPLVKINNQSTETLSLWLRQWNEVTAQSVKLKFDQPKVDSKKLIDFEVISTTALNLDDTFLIQLRPRKKLKFQSGDLIAFYPKEDQVERLYSIGKRDGTILLSVKRHEFGVCSNRLSRLRCHDTIKAKVKRNIDFHFPKHENEIIMIANGTGIAPFLGMINDNDKMKTLHLFWGGRTKASFEHYKAHVDKALQQNKLSTLDIAFSRIGEKQYVQDLVLKKSGFVANHLQQGGVIMICGSVAMQKEVLKVLQTISHSLLKKPLSDFEDMGQIKTDCY